MRIELIFLVPGHTKDVCDGKFGFVKRRLRRTDAIDPSHAMQVIRDSCKTPTCVPFIDVAWIIWKTFLRVFFKIPTVTKTSQYYVFTFDPSVPGEVQTGQAPVHINVNNFLSACEGTL